MERLVPVGLAFVLALSVAPSAQQAPVRLNAPQKIRHVDPVDPPSAQAARVEGVVILELKIATDGTVSSARVLRSIPLLDQAALEAVSQWVFAPRLLDGTPIEFFWTDIVTFHLSDALAAGTEPSARPGLAISNTPIERLAASLPQWTP